MNGSFDLEAIVVSNDARTISVANSCLKSMGVESTIHRDTQSAIQAMTRHKIDAFFVDRELDPELAVLSSMRASRSAQRSLAVAIVPPEQSGRGNYRVADFVLDKPLVQMRVNQILRAAYGMMLKERMRYSRLAICTEATLVDSMNQRFIATTTNVSQSGIALQSEATLVPGETVRIQFSLPDTSAKLKCIGQIIWRDQEGKAGLAFKEIDAADQQRLRCWIEGELMGSRYQVSPSGTLSVAQHLAVAACAVNHESVRT